MVSEVEDPMKLGAHPLVVAVAFGLLGPNALADDGDDLPIEEHRPAKTPAFESDEDPLELAVAEAWAEMVDLRVDPDGE